MARAHSHPVALMTAASIRAIAATLTATMLTATAAQAWAAPAAQSAGARTRFTIPAQPLGAALRQFGIQSNQSILFSDEDVRAHRSPAVSGWLTSEQVLVRLINGSGLRVSRTPAGAILLSAPGPSSAGLRHIAMAPQTEPPAVAEAAPPPVSPPPVPVPAVVEDAPIPAGLEEIVVTAQKRAENVQDTPISIAVLNSAQLEQRGIGGFQDLVSGAIPALKIAPFSGRSSSMSVTMRGITSGDATQISRDSAVGIYVDGVYLGRVQGLGTDLFDVERIEVLRGPQGTLFGRNAVGGAVNIISRRPTGELGVDATGSIGNYDARRLRATLNLPEFANISIKLDGLISTRDGWIDNPYRGAWDWGESRKHGLRAQALWQPIDGVEALYSYDISKDKSSPAYGHLVNLLPDAAIAPIFGAEPDRVKTGRIGVPLEPSIGKVSGHALNLSWRVNDTLTLRSISAWRKLDQSQDDNDAGNQIGFRPNGLFARESIANVHQTQFSQEIQLVGTLERLHYVVGLFHFNEDARDSAYAPFHYRFNADGTDFTVLAMPTGGLPPDRASQNHVKSDAIFGQATWTPPILDDRLHLTAGLRYTHDRKHGTLDLLRGVASNLAYRFASKRTDPMATIAYDLSDAVNVYVKYGVAYRAGGGNSRSATFRSFGEEEVRAWEAGLKSEFWDRRARLNIAAFTSDYRDVQVTFPLPSNPSSNETVNAAETIKIKGIEADLTLAPITGLTLMSSYSYLHTKVPPIISPLSGLSQQLAIAYSPKHSGTVGVDYAIPVADMRLILHADANYSTAFHAFATSPRSPGYLVVNGRITLADIPVGDGTVSVSLWGRNLFNEQFETFKFRFAGAGLTNADVANLNEPRMYGLEATVRF